MINVSMSCNDGHDEVWTTSDSIKAGRFTVPLIHLSIICYSLFTGLHWAQFKVRIRCILQKYCLQVYKFQAFCDKIGIVMFTSRTFYRYLSKLVYPCTYEFWLKDQAKSVNEVLVVLYILNTTDA